MTVHKFIAKWRASGASERSNYALFFSELADLLGVPRPAPATDTPERDDYVIDRVVTTEAGATNYIDLYKRGSFVAEAKQGSDAPDGEREALGLDAPKRRRGTARRGTRGWETAMQKAKGQARRYARALPEADGWPPFLLVVDVGHCFDLYADFSGQGKAYTPFPDQQRYRVTIEELEDEDVRERLRFVWTDPLALDPQRRSVAATRELAVKLAKLARSLEDAGNPSDAVADFLLRSLFTMFAEDVRLLPERSFAGLLGEYRERPETAAKAVRSLWEAMKGGGFAGVIGDDVRRFNGPLFEDPSVPDLTAAQLDLLAEAAKADWSEVEPAIFGTLIEQALDPVERHRLGAHYTPRAYVERLVLPTVVEPLREEWEAAQAAAELAEAAGDEGAARDELAAFHRRLCSVRVLDPACGTANFLYVTLEHLKRLEGEVLAALERYPGQQTLDMTGGYTVSPGQLLGIEFNGRAAAIARVVLYIGYLQWHFRTFGSADRLDPPILRDYGTIEHRDAVLDADGREPALDERGEAVTRWDGRTMRPSPVDPAVLVPDPTARVPAYRYDRPAPAVWPEAEFVVGNPPFVGSQRMRDTLGDGYTEALRAAYPDVPGSADLVMYWWHKAAEAVRAGRAERFGLITTNSVRQVFNRAVVASHLAAEPPLSLAFAVPDHPWTYDPDGAAVRIAMTVGVAGEGEGRLVTVTDEERGDELGQGVELAERTGTVWPDLSVGADVAGAAPLRANADLAFMGVKLVQPRSGPGFVVTEDEAARLGLGTVEGAEARFPRFKNGSDLTRADRGVRVIDFYGLTATEARERFPDAYQHVLTYVKPFRDQNNRKVRRENWWLHGETLPAFREAVAGLPRYIATSETSKHRVFTFLDADVLPDGAVIAVCLDDAYHFGVLSSRSHAVWAHRAGGRNGMGNDLRYNATRTFQPFPFPAPTDEQAERVRAAGDAVYRQREGRRASHPALTLTDVYNVLDALGEGRELTDAERGVYEAGAVGVLRELHAELDAAVVEAYGWPADLDEGGVVDRLVALNAERAAEEARGLVRYLRPAHQNPEAGDQVGLDVGPAPKPKKAQAKKEPWPRSTRERIAAVRRAVERAGRPAAPADVAKSFSRAKADDVADVLDALDALGHVHRDGAGRYAV